MPSSLTQTLRGSGVPTVAVSGPSGVSSGPRYSGPFSANWTTGGPSPLAYWTFDSLSGGGGVAADQQGNYDGTVEGATLTTGNGGRFGEALVLDGDDDFMSPGVIPELINPSAFSVS